MGAVVDAPGLRERHAQRLRLVAAITDDWEPGAAETLLAGLTRLRDGLLTAADDRTPPLHLA